MKKARVPLILLLLFGLLANLFLPSCKKEAQPELRVVTGTTLISANVAEVGGGLVSAVSIIPPTLLPDDFELKPEDISVLSDADLLIIHDWQEAMFSPEVIAQTDNSRLVVETIALPGDWMIPSVQIAATDKVTDILMRIDSQNSAAYRKAAASHKKMVSEKEAMILTRANLAYKDFVRRNIPSFNIICDDTLVEFIKWLGVKVVGTYGRPDSITTDVIKELIIEGRYHRVVLVVDSIQSGNNSGADIAPGVGATRTIISSYPGGFKNTETWEKTIDRNIGYLLGALNEC
ncbi:MAG: zinc ABC transporter substrate-binding protein [Chloroflexota bacterium]